MIAKNKELRFPEVDARIKRMSSLEMRFICLRIAFLQIREFHFGDLFHKGRVVNVPTNVDECIRVLPRVASETDTCPIQLRRQMSNSHYYLYEMVRPNLIIEAVRYLKDSEVYDEKVVLDEKRLWDDIKNCEVPVSLDDSADISYVQTNDDGVSSPGVVEDDVPLHVSILETAMLDKTVVFAPGEKNVPLGLFVWRKID